MIPLGNDWDDLLKDEFKKDYYLKLRQFLKREYGMKTVYPDMYKIFEALRLTSCRDTRVVILGQDPYHGPRQAHGLAFSVQEGVEIPPSLMNIYKELETDLGCYIPNNGCLIPWAKQGVLLLNTSLTVVAGQANSHRNAGWGIFTDRIIQLLNDKPTPVEFLLWKQCEEQNGLYHQQQASGAYLGTSEPAFRRQGIFRLPAFFPGQCIPGRHGAKADRLADTGYFRLCFAAGYGEGMTGEVTAVLKRKGGFCNEG